MIAKLIVEGKEFDIEILDPKLQELLTPKKKTGYERVDMGKTFYSVRADGTVFEPSENRCDVHKVYYEIANYHSSKDLAEDNARADTLMRQLRRFAVESRTKDNPAEKYYIHWVKHVGLQVMRSTDKHFGPWFDTLHNAVQAIKTFQDDLTWYFVEYRDSL